VTHGACAGNMVRQEANAGAGAAEKWWGTNAENNKGPNIPETWNVQVTS